MRRLGFAVLGFLATAAAPPAVHAQCHDFRQALFEGQGGVSGLENPVAVAASPDGRHVYVAGLMGDSVAVFEHDPLTDSLEWVDVVVDGVEGVDGLDGASSIALSPDGRHVYATGEIGGSVVVFSRDAATGVLGFVEVRESPAVGIDHLDGATDVEVSPDGRHVYVAGRNDDAIAVFSRNATSGSLGFLGGPRDGVGGVDGLDGATSLAVSADGRHVYAAGLDDDAVAVFARDAGTGALAFVESQRDGVGAVEGLAAAIAVSLAPDGSRLYLAGADDDAVAVFDRDPATGALSFVGSWADGAGGVDGLDAVNDVLVSPDGLWVHAAGYLDDAVAVFARNALGVALGFREAVLDGVGDVDGLRGASALAASPEGDRLYVTGGAENALAVLAVPPLRYVAAEIDGQGGVTGLEGVRGMALSPDGRHLYAAGSLEDAIQAFARHAASNTLAEIDVERDGVGGTDGLDGVESIAVSPDGGSVYAASPGADAVAVFARDRESGALTFVEAERDGAAGADGLEGAISVAVSPDSRHVYVAGRLDDAIAIFARDAATGALTFLGLVRNAEGGVTGLDGPRALVSSPDGRSLYAAAQTSGSVSVFARDAGTGLLAFVEAEADGVAGVDGLAFAQAVALSPDGRSLFAGGGSDDAMAEFARDPASGALTFVQVFRDGVDGVDGLDGISSVLVTRHGTRVLATGGLDEAVAVFERDRSTGAVAFRDAIVEECGVSGLGGAFRVAASADGGGVYVSGTFDDAIAVFAPEPGAEWLTGAAAAALAALGGRRTRRGGTADPRARRVPEPARPTRSACAAMQAPLPRRTTPAPAGPRRTASEAIAGVSAGTGRRSGSSGAA